MKSIFKAAIYVLTGVHVASALAANQTPPTDPKNSDNGYCDEQSLNLTIPSSLFGVYANSEGYKLYLRNSDDINYFMDGIWVGGIDSDFPKVLTSVVAPAYAKNCTERTLSKDDEGIFMLEIANKFSQYSAWPWDKITQGIKIEFLTPKMVKVTRLGEAITYSDNSKQPLVWVGSYCDVDPYTNGCD
jgi:hypothetical protein